MLSNIRNHLINSSKAKPTWRPLHSGSLLIDFAVEGHSTKVFPAVDLKTPPTDPEIAKHCHPGPAGKFLQSLLQNA